MNEGLYIALELMAIGMTTVFTILGLVVLGGRIMIILVNRFAPVEAIPTANSGGINSSTIAAITAAVEATTLGRGKITQITKGKS